MARSSFDGRKENAQVWVQVRPRPSTLIELSDNKGRFGLRYQPIHEELFQASKGKKRKYAVLGMSIPHIRDTFMALAEVIMLKPFKELEERSLI